MAFPSCFPYDRAKSALSSHISSSDVLDPASSAIPLQSSDTFDIVRPVHKPDRTIKFMLNHESADKDTEALFSLYGFLSTTNFFIPQRMRSTILIRDHKIAFTGLGVEEFQPYINASSELDSKLKRFLTSNNRLRFCDWSPSTSGSFSSIMTSTRPVTPSNSNRTSPAGDNYPPRFFDPAGYFRREITYGRFHFSAENQIDLFKLSEDKSLIPAHPMDFHNGSLVHAELAFFGIATVDGYKMKISLRRLTLVDDSFILDCLPINLRPSGTKRGIESLRLPPYSFNVKRFRDVQAAARLQYKDHGKLDFQKLESGAEAGSPAADTKNDSAGSHVG